MADEIRGQRMSDYTDIDQASELTETQKTYYKEHAKVTTFGQTGATSGTSNYNIPLSEIAGEALPPIESGDAHKVLTVNANEAGAHWDTVDVDVLPEIESGDDGKILRVNSNATGVEWAVENTYYPENPITGDGYHIGLNYDENQFRLDQTNGLTLKSPVPAPGTDAHRGEFLTVNNSDEIVWGTVSALPDTTGHSQGDVLAIGVSGPDWTAPVHIPVIGTINITPAPSYSYIILQNFLDGHTIGTPIPGESGYSDFYNKYPTDISTVWTTVEDWSNTNLVSTTAGDQLLYSDNSFDFSKYGLTAGQVPFGFCNGKKSDGAGYANITLPSEWTLETWFYSPLGDGEYTDPFWGSFFEIGPSYPNLIRLFLETNSISLFAMDNDVLTVSKTVTNQAWHHVALSCDGTNLYTFYDGELLGPVAIASVSGLSTMLASAVKVMVNVDSNGNGSNELWYAQLALCDSCKWTDDFTPSKEAY